MDAEPYWRSSDGVRTCRESLESWSHDWEVFDGAWILAECEADLDEDVLAFCLAQMLVIRVVANAALRLVRAEDLCDDVAEAMEYVAELELGANDARQLHRLLSALTPFNPERVCEQLLAGVWAARRRGLPRAARSLGELAYETTRRYSSLNSVAQGAAHALARLAELDECSFTARHWRGIAYVHGKRAARRAIVAG